MGVRDPRDLPAFRSWFEGSQIVDAQGAPLVLYHGTNADFSAFNRGMCREGDGLLWATPSLRVASDFALYRSTWSGANVMPVYVHAGRLLEVDGAGRAIRQVEDEAALDGMLEGEGVRAYALRLGYDAVLYRDVREDVGPNLLPPVDVYALFPSCQIKSALGNRGTYDPENPDLRMSVSRANRTSMRG